MTRLYERPAYAVLLACGFTFAVFVPTLFGLPDSFPLSTYPMFAKHRGQPTMVKLLATTANGSVPVPPELLGTGEVLQAKVLLERIAAKPAAKRRQFCEQTAQRLAERREASTWQRLELVRVKYDPIEYFYNDARPLSRKVVAQCSVHAQVAPPTQRAPEPEPTLSPSERGEAE